mmetsp:Transcript_6862/g.17679  ORF Transcript_6862/g.17679 Transcript_6862/m.17679 type:complete len:252 (-) Transcript_6862:613-1368(-)
MTTVAAVAMVLIGLCSVSSAHERLPSDAHNLSCTAADVDHTKTVVAAVGDSITVGATCHDWQGGYVKVLQDILGEKYDVRDCGLSGHDAVREGHGNGPRHASYWYSPALNQSLTMKPDIVIFMLGTNDAAEWYNTSKYYSQDYKDLVNEYIALPNKPRVVTMVTPPLGNFTCGAPNPTCLNPYDKSCVIDCVLPKLIPELTMELGLAPPLDLLSLFGGPLNTNKTALPGLHPDCDGYTLMAHFIAKQVFGV